MNFTQIEENLKSLIAKLDREEFIYEFLKAYGLPKASITRLQQGTYNLAKDENEVLWKKRVHYRIEEEEDLHEKITELSKEIVHEQRFVIVTDFETLLARDTETKENLDILLKDLPKHYAFFLPWAGMEKTAHQNENPADIKAAEKMAKLFDEIKKDNPDDSPQFTHDLNVFLSRLLFCLFAEDTEIFPEGIFTNGISSHTNADGSDLYEYLNKLFEVLNTPEKERANLPAHFEPFPFVNGGLFKDQIQSPKFTRKSRQRIIESGELDWSEINPDIFGSMMQAVITPEHRGGLGMHYTSVPNIMKVIKPLFLDELYEEFEKAEKNPRKLKELLNRLHNVKIFDPACGSGNFLIIAYKELRRLEMKIFKSSGEMALSGITLDQFYGIELDDFAHEIAHLSLWLAEHQMNVEFFKEFGRTNPTLPLKETGKIVRGNACRLDWTNICTVNLSEEVYLLGNPPYLGTKYQNDEHKKDTKLVLGKVKSYKSLDYVSCWFYLASNFITNINGAFAFVATNSISQGVQAGILWPEIFDLNLEIFFAHQSFKWVNNAKSNAGVTCIITGVKNRSRTKTKKKIYNQNSYKLVDNINPYLTGGKNLVISKSSKPISHLPKMTYGSKPADGGYLILNEKEKNDLIDKNPKSNIFVKKYMGSQDLIKGTIRYCIWIEDSDLDLATSITQINERLKQVEKFRKTSKKKSTRLLAEYPHKFAEIRYNAQNSILVPIISSENREYIPAGIVDNDTVINANAFGIYNPSTYILGIILSKMHNIWVDAVGGKFKTDISYISTICYNAFPFPTISKDKQNEITQTTFRIIEEREKYSDKTIADLYNPDKMPDGLLEAHQTNDEVIEKCYRSRPFESNEERLEYLLKQYEEIIESESNNETLFE